MYKKTLLSLAVASSVALTGCIGDVESGDDTAAKDPNPQGLTWPLFNPGAGELPVPSDLNFDSAQGDGTFGIDVPEDDTTIVPALNELSGASTVAPVVIQTNGTLDPNTVKGSMIRVGSDTSEPSIEVTPEAEQTVFLVELEYASGDPVQGLGNQEPSRVVATQKPYVADVEALDGQSAIRILPIEPLDPRKRYVVVVTNEVTDVNGDPITQSPTYEYLTAEAPVTAPLRSVQNLINGVWEPKALEFFGDAINSERESPLTAANIAMSFSITTSNDEKVLQYIAEPAAWFSDQLQTFVKVSATDGATSFAQSSALATGAAGGWPDIPANPDAPEEEQVDFRLALNDIFGSEAQCNGVPAGQAAFDCAGTALASGLVDQGLLPTPIPGATRFTTDFTFTTSEPVENVSPAAGAIIQALQAPAGSVLAAQGTLDLPYYLSNQDPGVVEDSWVADDTVAKAINNILENAGLERLFVQEDPEDSTAVNYIFPFPKEQVEGGVTVPVLALYPSSGTIKGAVIFQHGIGTDRSTAFTFGTALANQGYAVFAIDHPLHGISAEGSTVPTDSEVFPTNFDNERHFGLYAPAPGAVATMDFEQGVGDSGSLFINLTSFLTARDNLRQSVLDKMNLRASLTGVNPAAMADPLQLPDENGDPVVTIDPNGDVFFAGHSLGTVTGTPFVASVNENQVGNIIFTGNGSIASSVNDIQAASMLTPGGGVVRLLENSQSFAPEIIFGLGQDPVNLSQGDANLELYFNVLQAAFDTTDPINFVAQLAEGETPTPTLLLQANGDTVIPNGADANLWGPDNAPLKGVLDYDVTSELTVQVPVDSFNAPLAGGLPLSIPFAEGCLVEPADANHGTPVSAAPTSAFIDMVSQTVMHFTVKSPSCGAPQQR